MPLRFLTIILALFLLAACSGVGEATKKDSTAEESYLEGMAFFQKAIYSEAEASFKEVMEDYPLSPYAIESQLLMGEVYYAMEKYEDAGAYYTTFYTFHPTHPRAPYALFQKGMSFFKEILSIDRDQTFTKKALFAFVDLREAYPESPYALKAEELIAFLEARLAEREFYVGAFYFKMKNYKGALMRFRNILNEYPQAGLTDKTLYYIGESYISLGEEELAKEALNTLVNEFPESPYVDSARVRLNGG